LYNNSTIISDGSVLRIVENNSGIGTYNLRNLIRYSKDDYLKEEAEYILLQVAKSLKRYDIPYDVGTYCVYIRQNVGRTRIVKPLIYYPTYNEAKWKRRIKMLSGASATPATFPFLSIEEIKSAWYGITKKPLLPAIAGLIGSILSLLLGGLDFGIWLLVLACSFNFVFGKRIYGDEKVAFYKKVMKRIQFFIFPFVILSVINLLSYTLVFTETFKENHFLLVRGFVIFWLIIANVTSIFEGLEEKGYITPKQILSIKTAIEKSSKDAFKTFISSLTKKD